MTDLSHLRGDIQEWVDERLLLAEQEDSGSPPKSSAWHDSDDRAAYLLTLVSQKMGIVPEGRE